jgi:hypothetical protein
VDTPLKRKTKDVEDLEDSNIPSKKTRKSINIDIFKKPKENQFVMEEEFSPIVGEEEEDFITPNNSEKVLEKEKNIYKMKENDNYQNLKQNIYIKENNIKQNNIKHSLIEESDETEEDEDEEEEKEKEKEEKEKKEIEKVTKKNIKTSILNEKTKNKSNQILIIIITLITFIFLYAYRPINPEEMNEMINNKTNNEIKLNENKTINERKDFKYQKKDIKYEEIQKEKKNERLKKSKEKEEKKIKEEKFKELEMKYNEIEKKLEKIKEIEEIKKSLKKIENIKNTPNEKTNGDDKEIVEINKKFEKLKKSQIDNLKNMENLIDNKINTLKSKNENKKLKKNNEKDKNLLINFEDLINKKIKEKFDIYDSDRINKLDHALLTNGAQILSHSKTFNPVKWYEFNADYVERSPETALKQNNDLGECWSLDQNYGFMIVKLKNFININAVSIDHISPITSLTSNSAPKDFNLYGCLDEKCFHKKLLIQNSYKLGNGIVQTFDIVNDQKFNIVSFNILNNHGNNEYTCLYRLRIHGSI